MRRVFIAITTVVFLLSTTSAANATFKPKKKTPSIPTKNCSHIVANDGVATEWKNIGWLVKKSKRDEVKGTIYYYDNDANKWTTTKPSSYRYTMNMEQMGDLRRLKMCNTGSDAFFLIGTTWPMFTYYDKIKKQFIDIWWPAEDEGYLDIAAPFQYYTVMKLQHRDKKKGRIMYIVGDLRAEPGDIDFASFEDFPRLYLYREKNKKQKFKDATFNPNSDKKVKKMKVTAVTDMDDNMLEDVGFTRKESFYEVKQDLSELFRYADFGPTDCVRVQVETYAAAQFATSGSKKPQTKTRKGEYCFSQRGVRGVRVDDDEDRDDEVTVRWKKYKTKDNKEPDSYEVRLYDRDKKKRIKKITGVKNRQKKITGLKKDTRYRVTVRAKKSKSKKYKKPYSAWSSSARFHTHNQ